MGLAFLYKHKGDKATAEQLLRRALEIREKALGSEHPDTAESLNNLARLYHELRDYGKAEPLYQRALEIAEKVHGPEHLDTASGLSNLACLYVAMSAGGRAHDYGKRAIAAKQMNLGKILSFASEQQRLAYQRAHLPDFDLIAATGTPLEIATTALRWKGVVLDSVMEDRVVARQAGEGELRERLERLRSLKGRLMKLVMETPKDLSAEARTNREQERTRLEQELAANEGEMARKISALGRSRRALGVSAGQVQRALRSQEALIEFVGYSADLGKARWERRYGVVVLTEQGEPRWVQLGSAAEIDRAVGIYQKSVRGKTDETTLQRSLQRLHELVWVQVEKVLPAQTESIVISPDGPLSFVSFATLLDEQQRFLGERYAIRYVGSGRDLLSPHPAAPGKDIALFGNADFGAGGSPASAPGPSEIIMALRSAEVRDFGQLKLSPLPGTAEECRRLEALATAAGWTVQNHQAAAATETALVHQSQPGILHLATHGFFLPEEKVRNEKPDFAFDGERKDPLLVNPMHRSGVALSGAQRTLEAWQQGKVPASENDGILTADEVAGLDLEGTWLVTLSACETGVGEARSGEGVLGLRRAFVQAGAGNLLMTLWPVNDQMTAEIMEAFYRRALATGDAAQALIETQREWLLKLRKENGLLHAVNRAGPFILSSLGPTQAAPKATPVLVPATLVPATPASDKPARHAIAR